MKILTIKLSPFVKEQKAYLIEGYKILKKYSFPLESMTDIIFTSDQSIDKVIFYGDKKYLMKYIKEAKEKEMLTYGENKIIFEVRGA